MTSEQDTRNIALKLFRVVNGTGDGGSELAFDCLNSGIQKGWMRLAKIGAKDKVMNELERSIDAKDKELAEVRAKLDAAEARIKASQEQEPVGYMTDSGMYKIDGSFWQAVGDVVFKWRKLYAQPPIPPELAELQCEITLLRTGDTCARHCEGEAFRHEAQRLKRENAELRKQLEVREGWQLVPQLVTGEMLTAATSLVSDMYPTAPTFRYLMQCSQQHLKENEE